MYQFYSAEKERISRLLGVDHRLYFEEVEKTKACKFPFESKFFSKYFIQAGMREVQVQVLFMRLFVEVIVSIFFLNNNKFLLGVLFLIAALFFELTNIQRKIFHRAERFERDYPAMLLSLVSAVRTGIDPLIALAKVGDLFPVDAEIRQQLLDVKNSLDSGMPEDEAVRSFGRSINHPDIRLFCTAFILSRKQGSSLGKCLQRLVKVTRQRQSFRRKAKAAVAMQRLSAFGIAGCSVVIGGMQILMNATAFMAAWSHPLGFKAMVGGTLLLTTGLVWMLRLGKTRI